MKKVLSTILALLAISATAFGAGFPKGSPKFHTDYNAAMKMAQEKKKPLLVVFSATWCPPCQANKRDVYPSSAVKPFHDDFVWVYLDTDVKKNVAIAQKFAVSGIPHIQFVNSNGKSIDQSVGGTSPKSFAKKLGKVLKKAN